MALKDLCCIKRLNEKSISTISNTVNILSTIKVAAEGLGRREAYLVQSMLF